MPKNSAPQGQPLAKVNTDSEGRFRLMQVAAGAYVVRALAPGFISTALQNFEQGKSLTLDEGEAVEGIDLSLKRGAVITGHVTDANDQPLIEAYMQLWRVNNSQNERVYLVPTERERASDGLRFAQATVQSDGTFSFTGVAPGKYWTLARVLADEELTGAAPRQLVWDVEGRNTLRKEAEAENQIMELHMCQRIVDYSWRYAPQTVTTKPTAKKGC